MKYGRCLCGEVTFRTDAQPLVTSICWCRDCQFFGAGNSTVNVGFPRDELIIEGVLTDYASLADSGSHMHRRFCPTCGTPMFSSAEERPSLIWVRAGTLDDPSIV